ncbi:DUF2515 family protein [Evansella tamaricis]|uniref:DUF2515 domain-containing protein n=1 Tax=Evansella tamaricis TaxID=2069301 RepID=A0ABS6JN68_9BACI|nr:DUF2515 family protein [Evansella tamaricis]MBU9714639.1 DUF2515 domain-containing protein [Evansella tamaricis]
MYSHQLLIKSIKSHTEKRNMDNISRTDAYQSYFLKHNEISWAYLASMVSRNAGWSMSDLWSKPYSILLSKENRHHLFITYERANWLIFSDAYPQLLIYEKSKQDRKPLFDLLSNFHVSEWMINEWYHFWNTGNKVRLLHALIVNEQHLIQEPVIESPFFHKKVFHNTNYYIQEKLHFSVVLFPTDEGKIYGVSIKKFNDVHKRIELGKQLAWILLNSPVKEDIYHFFIECTFTGSRKDYQKEMRLEQTPMVRTVYPIVIHGDHERKDWSKKKRFSPEKLLKQRWQIPKNYEVTEWYRKKQSQVAVLAGLKGLISTKYNI